MSNNSSTFISPINTTEEDDMYHSIDQFCDKINLIKLKADALQIENNTSNGPNPGLKRKLMNIEIADIQALCADLANDRGHLNE